MSKSSNQKIKLLALWDILLHNTDKNRALSTDEIIALLKEKNIDVARKVLPEDIALLNKCAALRAAATSTRHEKDRNGKPNRKARRRGAVPAEPLR